MREENKIFAKLEGTKRKYKVICSCSCRISFYPFEHKTKKKCRWCGRTVYINKQEEFKEKLLKSKKRRENES